MRAMGIDYGQKYIGIAISDEAREFAFPKTTIENKNFGYVVEEIKKICKSEKIEKIIIGLPLSKDMSSTPQTRIVKDFAQALKESIPLDYEFENELFSTKIIEKNFGKNKKINESAAAVILQGYLDKNKQNLL